MPEDSGAGNPAPAKTPARSGRLGPYAGAMAAYLGLSFLYFGLPVAGRFTTRYVGLSSDPSQFMWSFQWIIYAIGHRLNPFYTHLIWAPKGYDLSFTTFVPGMSLLSMPLTLLFGPVATYNVWQIANPGLAAFFTFLICYHVTKKYLPSLAGGYFFGFSAYEVLQNLNHPNLSTIFLVPLMVYLVLLLMSGRMGKKAFVAVFSLALIMQFLTSLEVFATFTMFGAIVFVIGYIFGPEAERGPLKECVFPLILSYVFATIVVSPYLYLAVKSAPAGYVHNPYYWVNDLLNFIIPTPFLAFSGLFGSITGRFTGNAAEYNAYFGIGLLIVLYLFARDNWRRPGGRLLLFAFLLPAFVSLGPEIRVAGKAVISSPFWFLMYAPLIREAQFNRMAVYASLPAAVMVALWLAERKSTFRRIVLLLFAAELLVPGLPYPSSPVGVPPFISRGLYQTYIPRGSNVLIIPFANRGNSMLWQAETNFYFTMAAGYLGYPPRRDRLSVMRTLYTGRPVPGLAAGLRSFLDANRVRFVLVDAAWPGDWRAVFQSLGVRPRLVGGVWLYRVPGTGPPLNSRPLSTDYTR